MATYCLDVVEPRGKVTGGDTRLAEEKLESALEAIAETYGGMIPESLTVSENSYQSRFVLDILDCKDTLDGEIEWLRGTFPDIRFSLTPCEAAEARSAV